MLQQLHAPVWATCQCITLKFVNIHHPTPAPILWYFTNLHHIITHISHPQSTNFAYSLKHLCHNPVGPTDLPCFIFQLPHQIQCWDPFDRPTHWTYNGQTSVPSKTPHLISYQVTIMCSSDFHQLIFYHHNPPIIILYTARTQNTLSCLTNLNTFPFPSSPSKILTKLFILSILRLEDIALLAAPLAR